MKTILQILCVYVLISCIQTHEKVKTKRKVSDTVIAQAQSKNKPSTSL